MRMFVAKLLAIVISILNDRIILEKMMHSENGVICSQSTFLDGLREELDIPLTRYYSVET